MLSVTKDVIPLDDSKIRFLFKRKEIELYCESFVYNLTKVLYSKSAESSSLGFKIKLFDDPGREPQVKLIIELPDFGPSDWLSRTAVEVWKRIPISGEVLFEKVLESLEPDLDFLDDDWAGPIHGFPAAL
jgi:hypothetical protein